MNIFMSFASVRTPAQLAVAEKWINHFARLQMSVLPELREPSIQTLPTLKSRLLSADGAVVLGFRQLQVKKGSWRLGTVDERRASRWWATPWNHVEAGMAIMAGIPVLLLRDSGIHEGIFDPQLRGNRVYAADLDAPGDIEQVTAWVTAVRGYCAARMEAWSWRVSRL